MLHVVDLSHPTSTRSAEIALYDMADRLGLGSAIVTGGEIDLASFSRLQAADRAAAPVQHPHNTEMERLWIAFDPEFPAYQAALADLRARAAASKSFFIVLCRKPGWLDGADSFSAKPVRTWQKAQELFARPDEMAVAIAKAGRIIACKK